jgi:hypothetical protein
MRAIFLCIAVSSIFPWLAAGDGPPGVPPRPRPSDYPVRQSTKTATIAAAIVPPDQAGKMFSPEIAKQYIVVEVAVYPESGDIIDVKPLLFALRVGDRIGGAEQPADVSPGPDNHSPSVGQSTGVTTETGVLYGRATGPVNGRSSQNLEAYSAVTVASGDARQPVPPAPSNSGPDPRIVADRLWNKALPEGQTGKAVAGYLYFPQYAKKRKSDARELSYSDNDVSAMLLFPK